MPCVPVQFGDDKPVSWLTFAGDYKPGDPPPEGYCDKFEWAQVQLKAGLKQVQCSRCSLWRFPQELARFEEIEETVYLRKYDVDGITMKVQRPVCLACAAKEPKP